MNPKNAGQNFSVRMKGAPGPARTFGRKQWFDQSELFVGQFLTGHLEPQQEQRGLEKQPPTSYDSP